MKRSILFLLLLSGIMAACTSDKKSQSTGDPIEDLIYFLDKQEKPYVTKVERYKGGDILTTETHYSINACTQKYWEEKNQQRRNVELEIADSCLTAFSWGCRKARQCYHKENHVMNRDSVVYALALDAMDGERIELQGANNNYGYFARFKAARAATMNYQGDNKLVFVHVEYITRDAKGKAEPFDNRPIDDFIKQTVETTDSMKAYDVSYELTAEDYEGNPSLVSESYYDEECTLYSKSKGRLYVIPASKAKSVFESLEFMARNEYIGLHPNQEFVVYRNPSAITVCRNDKEDYPYSTKRPYLHKSIRGYMPLKNGRFYILVLDETIGAFALPWEWHKVLRIKDHKVEYIPEFRS